MKKILIIRFSSIGDIVLTSPVTRCIKNSNPNIEIHFLTKAAYKELLIPNPHITKVWTIKSSIMECLKELKKEDFDEIIDLHNNLRSAQLKLFLKAESHSVSKKNISKFKLVTLKSNERVEHIVYRYLNTVKHLCQYDFKGLDFHLDKNTRVQKPFEKYNVLVIGAKFRTKQLHYEGLLEICKNSSLPLILLGGKEDIDLGNKLQKEGEGNCLNMCGTLTLAQSALIIKGASKVVSHDTGLMHIACAFNKNIAVIWGNTTPLLGFAPFMPQKSISNVLNLQVDNLDCRPCSKIGYVECPKQHFNCMHLQNLPKLINWLNYQT